MSFVHCDTLLHDALLQASARETLRLFENTWPILPATAAGSMRVLLQLTKGMPVVRPRDTNSSSSSSSASSITPVQAAAAATGLGGSQHQQGGMTDNMRAALGRLGVQVLDTQALGSQADNPCILEYVK
jgi:hypothetical protein